MLEETTVPPSPPVNSKQLQREESEASEFCESFQKRVSRQGYRDFVKSREQWRCVLRSQEPYRLITDTTLARRTGNDGYRLPNDKESLKIHVFLGQISLSCDRIRIEMESPNGVLTTIISRLEIVLTMRSPSPCPLPQDWGGEGWHEGAS